MTYKVMFEINGLKKFIRVEANSEQQARDKLIKSFIIYKVKRDIDPEVEKLMNLMGMKP